MESCDDDSSESEKSSDFIASDSEEEEDSDASFEPSEDEKVESKKLTPKKSSRKRIMKKMESSSDSDSDGVKIKRKRRSSKLDSSDSEAESELTPTAKKKRLLIKSDEEQDSKSESEDSTPKPKRTPKSSLKDERMEALNKLKAKRSAKQKLVFQDSSEEEESKTPISESDNEVIDEYNSSDDFQSSNEEDTSESDEYEEDGFVVDDYKSSSKAQKELENLTQMLSRSSEKDRANEDKYWEAVYGKKKKEKKNGKEKEKPDEHYYKLLISGLKKYATNPKLPDKEIVKEFVNVGFDVDEFRSEECICGKTELKYLYYMKNRKITDHVEYALTTFIVGSKCIEAFHKARKVDMKHLKASKPIEFEFMKWSKDGIIGHFRKSTEVAVKVMKKGQVKKVKKTAWIVTISSKAIAEDFEGLSQEYKADIKIKKNNAVDIRVLIDKSVLKKLEKTYLCQKPLQKDSRHKFFINYKVDDFSTLEDSEELIPTNFYLNNLESPESKVSRSSEPTSGKDFLN